MVRPTSYAALQALPPLERGKCAAPNQASFGTVPIKSVYAVPIIDGLAERSYPCSVRCPTGLDFPPSGHLGTKE